MLQEIQKDLQVDNVEIKGMKQLYFILWTIGEKFPPQKTLSTHELPRHENYLKQAYRDGRLLMAALFENGSGVITLMEAETEHEIHKFVRNNPEVMDKRIQARIKPCKPVHWKSFN